MPRREHAAGESVSRTHLRTPTLQGEAASLPRFSELVRRGKQAEERMKLWEQAAIQI
jgi:hypothetical protein